MEHLIKLLFFLIGGLFVFVIFKNIQSKQHEIWDMAFDRGYTQAESFYKGILEIETSRDVIEAKCMLFNFDFEEEK
tara:strand:+ start:1322 stop:1549 length:228 start_codon:yes stop_codon:yes gene_type:complete